MIRFRKVDAIALLVALVICFAARLATAQMAIGAGSGGVSSPVINTGPPLNGQVGVPYTFTAMATGGTQPYTWSTSPSPIFAGENPINASTGVLTGTPTTAGTYTFTLKATDANNQVGQAQFTVQIINQLQINPVQPPTGVVNQAYSFTFTAIGGTLPYSWTVVSGTNPPTGTSLNPATGVLSGMPTVANTFAFIVKVTDSETPPVSATQNVSITINGSAPTCGPPNFCSSQSAAVIQNPAPPFTGTTGMNTIACDPSINGACSSTAGIDPIVRVTDQTIRPDTSGGWSCTVTPSGSANDNLFNVGNTRIIFKCVKGSLSNTYVAAFNPTTMQVSNVTALPATLGFPYWSRINADILYAFRTNGNIDQYVFNPGLNTFTQTTIFNVLTSCSGLSALAGSSFASAAPFSGDATDTLFEGITTSSGQQSTGWVIIYDKANGKCSFLDSNTGNITLEDNSVGLAVPVNSPNICWPIGMHAGSIMKHGLYAQWSEAPTATCSNSSNSNVTAWQLGTRNVTACDNSISSSCSANHNTHGYDVEVFSPVIAGQASGFPVFIHFKWSDTLPPPLTQWYGAMLCKVCDEHITVFGNGANIDTNPITGVTDQVLWNGSNFTYAVQNEIFAMFRTPLGSAPTVRFAHSFNSGATLCPACDFRSQQGISATSQDGKFLIWTSDMRLGLGTDAAGNPRQDLFIIRLD